MAIAMAMAMAISVVWDVWSMMTRKGKTTNTEMQRYRATFLRAFRSLTKVASRVDIDIVPFSLRFNLLDVIAALDVCGSFKASPSIHLCNHLRTHQANSRIGVYYSTRNATILGILGIPSLPLFVGIFLLPTGLYMHPMTMMAGGGC
ncbi:MAG: hypothetical protein NXY57DRAFT_44610 [Lentinula lateritia]|nr:MAG: hypothetical protein NXY57DRAFT_44610 [Lentinula lateritia]